MKNSRRKSIILSLLGAGLLGWQSWQEALLIETDPGLDSATLNSVTGLPVQIQELSLYRGLPLVSRSVFLAPRPRLKLAFQQPAPTYTTALYKQAYFQVVASFQDLRPPFPVHNDGSAPLPASARIYTADPLAFAAYRARHAKISLLANDQDVIAKIQKEAGALGILHVNRVIPQVRALTPPFPIQLWLGWRECPWRWLSQLGINERLFATASYLLSHAQRQPKPRLSSLVAVGDIMLARRIGHIIGNGKDSLYPFGPTRDLLFNADVATGNLECAISKNGSPMPEKDYVFRAAPDAVGRLKSAGFAILNLANNHSMDYGGDALTDTVLLLNQAGIATVGAGRNHQEASQLRVVILKDGTKLGFISYTQVLPENFIAGSARPGVQWAEENGFKRGITAARPKCDVLIVQFHWGEQYKAHPNAIQRRYGHLAIDYGADLVVGHHPHWIQDVEFYKDKFIAYSLGNYVFDMDHRPKVREGLALKCLFKGKSLHQIELNPVLIKRGQPEILPWGTNEPRNRETILRELFTTYQRPL